MEENICRIALLTHSCVQWRHTAVGRQCSHTQFYGVETNICRVAVFTHTVL